jgi:peptide/nickel transport system substrate-binding protein
MNIKTLYLLLLSISLFLIISCNSKLSDTDNRIVVGISADVQSFNSLFAFSYEETVIADLLYPGLLDFQWNEELGDLDVYPMIAKSWQWSDDSSTIKFILRDDIKWSDGEMLTTEDVVFSYDVYSDPIVQSRLLGTFDEFFTELDGHIDVKKTFNILSEYEFEIHFPEDSNPDLNKIVVPIIPRHILTDVIRDELGTHESNFHPVSSGAFKLKKWDQNQTIVLEADSNSFLFQQGQVSELVFKIIPDYTSRILQIKKGDIDLVELVKVEDIEGLAVLENISVKSIVGREYDYVGWNNLDVGEFAKGKVTPHKLFGNSKVRKALTLAINREEILDQYLLNQGILAATPVSPIFKSAFNGDVKPYEFSPEEAKKILMSEGWKDENKNGILEKGNTEFKFTLYFPVGNPLREYAAVIIKNNLNAIGINVTNEKMELGAFIDNLYEKKLDAWLAGWGIPIPLDLKPYWYSDPDVAVLNFAGYRNAEADKILDQLEMESDRKRKNDLIKKFQEIIHIDEPVTFLYWTPNLVVYNKKIKNLNPTPYGVLVHCWKWKVN